MLKAAALRNALRARPNYCVACAQRSREGCAAPLYEGYLLPFLYPTPRPSPSKPYPTRPYPFRSSLVSRVIPGFSVSVRSVGAAGGARGRTGANAPRASPPSAVRPPAGAVAVRYATGRASGSRRRAQGGGHPAQPHRHRQTRPAGTCTLPLKASRSGLPGRVKHRRPRMAEDIQCGQPPHLHVRRGAGHAPASTAVTGCNQPPTCTSVQGPDVPPPPSELHGAVNHPTRTTVEAPDVPPHPPQARARLRGSGEGRYRYRSGMAEDIQCGQPPHLHVRRGAGHAPAPTAVTGCNQPHHLHVRPGAGRAPAHTWDRASACYWRHGNLVVVSATVGAFSRRSPWFSLRSCILDPPFRRRAADAGLRGRAESPPLTGSQCGRRRNSKRAHKVGAGVRCLAFAEGGGAKGNAQLVGTACAVRTHTLRVHGRPRFHSAGSIPGQAAAGPTHRAARSR